ncbi:MAG: sulfatase-like hydrolase/transferase [Lentimonas sp.]
MKQLTIVCFLVIGSLTRSIAEEQPNLLWILTDDHRYDSIRAFNTILTGEEMSPLGYVESPQTDRLAAMGTTFINTYCHAQGCAPSRASMHYGRYPFRSGVYEFEYHNNKAEHCRPTLPEQMRELGYQVAHSGKMGFRLNVPSLMIEKLGDFRIYDPQIYYSDLSDAELTEWGKYGPVTELNGIQLANPIKQIEFLKTDDGEVFYINEQLERENPEFVGTAQRAFDRFNLIRKPKLNQPADVFTLGILSGISPRAAGNTRDGVYTKAFLEFLKHENSSFKIGDLEYNGVDTSKPLFFHLGYDFPHTPVMPPIEYRERFGKYTYNVPEFDKASLESLPRQLRRQVENYYSDDLSDDEKQRMISDYYAFCAYGDALIGDAVDGFIEYNEKHRKPWTIVYVCGDHGWKLNDNGAYSKFTPWKVDTHTPIIVLSSDKQKFPAGKVVHDFTELVDIAPTFLAAGGADLNTPEFEYLDGYDLAAVASGELRARDYVLGESHAVIGPRAYIRTRDYVFSMQTRPHKHRGKDIEWALHADYKDLDPALYHTPSDPNEKNNLALDPKYQTIAKKMRIKLSNIVLGDNRVEVNWGRDGNGTTVYRSNFAQGADDKTLDL